MLCQENKSLSVLNRQIAVDHDSKKLMMNKGMMDILSYECAFQEYLLQIVNSPITEQAQIVNFFYFWWQKASIIKKCYKQFSHATRVQFKYKMIICQRYCQRYLGVQLNFWFEQILMTLDSTIPIRILIVKSEFQSTLEAIYKTHDPNFKEPVFSDSDEQQQPKTKKGIFASIFDKIYQKFAKRQEEKQCQYEKPLLQKSPK